MAAKHSKKISKKQSSARSAVADQPGLSVTLVGLVIAIVIGLSLRVMISPERIKPLLQTAIESSAKELDIKFESANVSLSNGFLPEFAVVLNKVDVISLHKACVAPVIATAQIKVPISFIDLLAGRLVIDEITAKDMKIHFEKTLDENCQKIHQFLLTFPIELSEAKVQIQSQSPKHIHFSGKINTGTDTFFADGFSQALIKIDYDETKKTIYNAELDGNWREGQYHVNADYDQEFKFLNANIDIKVLPLDMAILFLRAHELMTSDFDGRKIWVSFNAKLNGSFLKNSSLAATINKFKLEGDFGEIHSDHIEITSVDPVKYQAIQFNLKSVDFNKLLDFFKREKPTETFSNLGVFNGEAVFTGENQVEINGEHKNLEFIFANNGSREVQAVSSLKFKLRSEANRMDVHLYDIKLDNGEFDGDVKVAADSSWRNVMLNTTFKNLRFNQSVENIMSSGGQFKDFNGSVNIGFTAGQIASLQGQVKTNQLVVDETSFLNPRLTLETPHEKNFVASFAADKVILQNPSKASSALKDLMNTKWLKEKQVEASRVSGRFSMADNFQTFSWNQFQTHVDDVSYTSQGAWDEKGELTGSVQAAEKGRLKKWQIGGDRKVPLFKLQE